MLFLRLGMDCSSHFDFNATIEFNYFISTLFMGVNLSRVVIGRVPLVNGLVLTNVF